MPARHEDRRVADSCSAPFPATRSHRRFALVADGPCRSANTNWEDVDRVGSGVLLVAVPELLPQLIPSRTCKRRAQRSPLQNCDQARSLFHIQVLLHRTGAVRAEHGPLQNARASAVATMSTFARLTVRRIRDRLRP